MEKFITRRVSKALTSMASRAGGFSQLRQLAASKTLASKRKAKKLCFPALREQ
jgi:hypothetical protein